MLEINRIRIDGGTQSRVELNQETVAEYAEAYRAGALFPPVIVFFDGTNRWLADGFHRYFGAKAAGLEKIFEEIIPGTQRDAVLYSLKANATHGLRRTSADKRKAIETLLKDAEWSTWSDNAIAKVCGVGNQLVGDVRRSIFVNHKDAPTTRTVERNGKTYEQDTSNIGKASRFKGKPKKVPASKLLDAQIKTAKLEKEVDALRQQVAGGGAAAAAPDIGIPASGDTLDPDDTEDYGADFDPREELEAMNEEVTRLRKLLTVEDKAAEALKWQDLYALAERRSGEHLTTVNSRDKQIKFLARQLERCGKAVGELDQDKIAPAVEARIRAIREAA